MRKLTKALVVALLAVGLAAGSAPAGAGSGDGEPDIPLSTGNAKTVGPQESVKQATGLNGRVREYRSDGLLVQYRAWIVQWMTRLMIR